MYRPNRGGKKTPPPPKAQKPPPRAPQTQNPPPVVPEPSPPSKPVKTEVGGEYVTHKCGHRVGVRQLQESHCTTCQRANRNKKSPGAFGFADAPDKRLPDGSVFDIAPFVIADETGKPKWAATLTVPGFGPYTASGTALWPLLRHLDRMYRDDARRRKAKEVVPPPEGT